MNRRNALKLIGATGITITGAYWLTRKSDRVELSIKRTLERLYSLEPALITTTGEWNVSQTFEHLAQSIEFSMTGYPEMKSTLFQKTIGQLAFELFQSRGKMTHNLNEIIPGEIITTNPPSITNALNRLINALETFDSYDGVFKAHFAYGDLTKSEYTIAHIMHINNHFEEFERV